jgi:hypothetical protein
VPPPEATATPPQTVTVPPTTTSDPATATPTGAVTPIPGKHKRHKGAHANTDTQPTTPAQTGPVTTGVEPASCDANGDGVADPGSTCSGSGTETGTVTTGVQQGDSVQPASYSVPKKHKATLKRKVRQRRARAR